MLMINKLHYLDCNKIINDKKLASLTIAIFYVKIKIIEKIDIKIYCFKVINAKEKV